MQEMNRFHKIGLNCKVKQCSLSEEKKMIHSIMIKFNTAFSLSLSLFESFNYTCIIQIFRCSKWYYLNRVFFELIDINDYILFKTRTIIILLKLSFFMN